MATLTSITIENFKGIGDAVTIPIRPITLLFGKNNSGKSTVLQALQYMVEVYQNMVEVYQSAAGADPDRTKIGYTDLGGFRSLVHRHDEKRKIRIRLDFDLNIEESEDLKDHLKDKEVEVKSVSIEVVTGWEQNKEKAYPESLIIYRLNGVEWHRFTPTKRSGKMVEAFDERADLNWNMEHPLVEQRIDDIVDLSFPRLLGAFSLISLPLSVDRKTRKTMLYSIQIDIENFVKEKIKSINYLGPFREIPSRHFRPQKTPDRSLWAKGIEAWNILGRYPTLIEKTNSYMEDFLNLGYTIKIEESVPLDVVLKLHNEENDIDLDLPDVGLGVSQVIPVLVGVSHTGWSVAPDAIGIFAVEQPELHLHPAAQVALGDVFIDGIQNSNPTFLIETHSEHLLLRIMRRMRETFEDRIEEDRFPVTPNDIAVLFVESYNSRTIIREMPINERGALVKAWPGGFFEEDIEEVLA